MEGYCLAGTTQFVPEKQGKAGGDHFIVEELLDFSNEEDGDAEMAADEDGRSEETGGDSSANSISGGGGGGGGGGRPGSHNRFSDEVIFRSLADVGLSGDLCEPYEEMAELEWLSNFVEDSFSIEELHKQQLISGLKSPSSQSTHRPNFLFTAATAADPPVPGKARSKRARTAPCNWSSRLLLLSQTSVPSPSPVGRKCLHCATDKTPQWRAGPMGPKTLCNACGVRFKSGRLVPEYRPAASPTFVLSKHSNSHRKVLDLRRRKGIREQQHQFLPLYHTAAAATTTAGEDHRRIFG